MYKLNFKTMMDEITPPLYDMEIMFWIVVSKDLVDRYGLQGEQMARAWLRRHANWRGMQIRKGNQALGVPINVENLFAYTDNPVNNVYCPLWKKDFGWTPWNLKLKVSPGECAMWDRMKEHNVGFLGDVFCDELHQSFTTTYHPDAVVSVCRTMTKGDDHCMFQWVLPGDAKEPEKIEPYPGENVAADWKYDTEEDIVRGGIKRLIRWYGAAIYYLREILDEFIPHAAPIEFKHLLKLWEEGRTDCVKDRLGDRIANQDPKTILQNFDMPYTLTWNTEVTDIEGGIEMNIDYCPLNETWNWIGDKEKASAYCDTCYSTMYKAYNPNCKTELCSCMAKGDDTCKIRVWE